jgi:hypothetical protein
MDFDIVDLFEDFVDNAKTRNISVKFIGFDVNRSEKLKKFIDKI